MQTSQRRSVRTLDETRELPQGRAEIVEIGEGEVEKHVFEPGWRWSVDVRPLAGTEVCKAPHLRHHVSGRSAILMADGTDVEPGPGGNSSLASTSDARVVGEETVVTVDGYDGSNYVEKKRGRA